MVRYTALLRGVNLGPHRKVSMAGLRALLTGMGLENVSTYLQSGNAQFDAPESDMPTLERAISTEIRRTFGHDVPVLLRPPHELAETVASHPFPEAVATPSHYYIYFLSSAPHPRALADVDPASYLPDQFQLGKGRALYVWYLEGLHTSRLNTAFFDRRLGVVSTARNWNTVTRLLETATA